MQQPTELANERYEELIQVAEKVFGPMSSDWDFGGVYFQNHPPHMRYFPEEGVFRISLSERAINDDAQMYFQLSHEVCHSLYPAVSLEEVRGQVNQEIPATNVINEGISTYFSFVVVSANFGNELAQEYMGSIKDNSPNYYTAFEIVADLLDIDPDSVKKIREINPLINDLKAENLRASGLDLSEDLIEKLTQPFSILSN